MKHRVFGILASVTLLLALLFVSGTSRADFVVKAGGPIKHFGLKYLDPKPDVPVFVHTANFVDQDAEQPVKLLIVSFWASWCKPCKKELPLLQTYYEKYKDKGLMVLAVALDKEDDGIASARTFVQQHNFGFPVLSDYRNLVARQYFDDNVNLPAMLQIGPDGEILKAHSGYEEGFAEALERDIRAALGLPAEAPAPAVKKNNTKSGKKTGKKKTAVKAAKKNKHKKN